MSSGFSNAPGEPDVFSLARFFSHRLEEFLSPFLLILDQLLDRRLVSTFLGLCQSLESEGLCAVRSVKARRLLRIKRGYYSPPTRESAHVPGLRWVGLLCCGLRQQPLLASFRWWTSRGKEATSPQQVRLQLLQWAREQFGSAVLHVFDRGYASGRWLDLLLSRQDRFLLRWPSSCKLVDAKGQPKNACRFSVGKRATSSRMVWDMARKCRVRRSLLWMPCLHPSYPESPLTLNHLPARPQRPPALVPAH